MGDHIVEARMALLNAVARNRTRTVANTRLVNDGSGAPSVPAALRRHRVEHWEMITEDAEFSSQGYLPFRIVKPAGTADRLPCVILLHPTGSDQNYHVGWESRLVSKGYMTVTMDCRYHGRRVDDAITYQDAIKRAYLEKDAFEEKPFLLDNVWDLQHILDFLEVHRTDVGKIGITGLSLGGMIAWFLAVIDERVHAPVPLCGVQQFSYAIENNCYHDRVMSIPNVFQAAAPGGMLSNVTAEVVRDVWDTILPGMLETYDASVSLGAIAPRPLLVVTGALDPRNPVEGVRNAVKVARLDYEKQGCGEHIRLFDQENAGHELTIEMRDTIERWFDNWLKT
jgi:poly(3-hydroxybutyrate) depolymerase